MAVDSWHYKKDQGDGIWGKKPLETWHDQKVPLFLASFLVLPLMDLGCFASAGFLFASEECGREIIKFIFVLFFLCAVSIDRPFHHLTSLGLLSDDHL